MNLDTMNNQISSEQHLNIHHQQNDTKSKEVVNGIKKIKKSPMTTTPLYVSFFSLSIQHSNI
jgi:hypothetical protein